MNFNNAIRLQTRNANWNGTNKKKGTNHSKNNGRDSLRRLPPPLFYYVLLVLSKTIYDDNLDQLSRCQSNAIPNTRTVFFSKYSYFWIERPVARVPEKCCVFVCVIKLGAAALARSRDKFGENLCKCSRIQVGSWMQSYSTTECVKLKKIHSPSPTWFLLLNWNQLVERSRSNELERRSRASSTAFESSTISGDIWVAWEWEICTRSQHFFHQRITQKYTTHGITSNSDNGNGKILSGIVAEWKKTHQQQQHGHQWLRCHLPFCSFGSFYDSYFCICETQHQTTAPNIFETNKINCVSPSPSSFCPRRRRRRRHFTLYIYTTFTFNFSFFYILHLFWFRFVRRLTCDQRRTHVDVPMYHLHLAQSMLMPSILYIHAIICHLRINAIQCFLVCRFILCRLRPVFTLAPNSTGETALEIKRQNENTHTHTR